MTETSTQNCTPNEVLRLHEADVESLSELLSNYGLSLKMVDAGSDIPGSFWGDEEAGLIANELLVRTDTPLHSILHEACHYVCLDQSRRAGIHTDAGGDYDEENAVCYLQILLAEHIEGFGKQRMLKDMDSWGYSFRLGSAQSWFEKDAQDALTWLQNNSLLDAEQQPNWKLREN